MSTVSARKAWAASLAHSLIHIGRLPLKSYDQSVARKKFSKNEITVYDFRRFLSRAFAERIKQRPSYSLRSFARFLSLDASTLQKLMTGKRALGTTVIKRLGQKLQLSPEEIEKYVAAHSTRRKLGTKLETDQVSATMTLIGDNHAPIIASWKNYVILELIDILKTDFDARLVAKALKVPVSEAQTAIKSLQEIGWIKFSKGTWQNCIGQTTLDPLSPVTIDARKKLMRDIILNCARAFDDVPAELRKHHAATFAVSRDLMDEAIVKIRTFTLELTDFLRKNSSTYDEVFQLVVGYYPVTRLFEDDRSE